jgi:hypothetical protein
MLDQIKEFVSTIPKPVIFAVVLLVLVAGFFLWKKFSSKDSENEVIKGAYVSEHFAKGVQEGLDPRDREDAPMMSALTPGYAKEVQTGLGDLETEDAPVVAAIAPEEALDESDDDFENYE